MSSSSLPESKPKRLDLRHWFRNFRNRVNVDRLLVIILTFAVLVLGWTSVQNSKANHDNAVAAKENSQAYHTFTNCVVDYFKKDRAAQTATTTASRSLVTANNQAFKTIPIFFGQLLGLDNKPATTKQTSDLIKSANDIQTKFNTSNNKYEAYKTAIKNNPRPPDPTRFCKSDNTTTPTKDK